MIYQRSCTDDTHFVYLHALGYICIIYWGTQNASGELFKKINMRHFLGSLHQVFVVPRIFDIFAQNSIAFNN